MPNELITQNHIKDKIYTIRGLQVMIDSDLAQLYQVSTKVLNQAVKRNIERFPSNFMFQLTNTEHNLLRSQIVTSKDKVNLRFQNGTSKLNKGGRTYLPYVFTEQGVAMLSGVLKSDVAVRTSIQIINAFVEMRRFISKNAQLFQRLSSVERKQIEHDHKFEKIFKAIEDKQIKPSKGIFFNGQIFDAYKFVSDLIRKANKSIIIIDNYIDDTVLTLFSKQNKNVNITIYTNKISKQLSLDLNKYNSQYKPIKIKQFKHSHDRFMIIDNKKVYHIGASLKDLGKKWFAFSKFDKQAFNIINKLNTN